MSDAPLFIRQSAGPDSVVNRYQSFGVKARPWAIASAPCPITKIRVAPTIRLIIATSRTWD